MTEKQWDAADIAFSVGLMVIVLSGFVLFHVLYSFVGAVIALWLYLVIRNWRS